MRANSAAAFLHNAWPERPQPPNRPNIMAPGSASELTERAALVLLQGLDWASDALLLEAAGSLRKSVIEKAVIEAVSRHQNSRALKGEQVLDQGESLDMALRLSEQLCKGRSNGRARERMSKHRQGKRATDPCQPEPKRTCVEAVPVTPLAAPAASPLKTPPKHTKLQFDLPKHTKPQVAFWDFRERCAVFRRNQIEHKSKELCAENPEMGLNSGVIATFRFADCDPIPVKVHGIWWRVVQMGTMDTTAVEAPAVFRPVTKKQELAT